MSEMLKHLVLCYKYGIKQLYYFNTNDQAGEIDVNATAFNKQETTTQAAIDQEDCDSCVI
jgi:hypothetical protein